MMQVVSIADLTGLHDTVLQKTESFEVAISFARVKYTGLLQRYTTYVTTEEALTAACYILLSLLGLFVSPVDECEMFHKNVR
jgi:hypothetical protein